MRHEHLSVLRASEPRVVGRAPAFLQVLRLLDRVAPTDRAVLIAGPTGSGKEIMAQLVHYRGRDPQAPFLDLNCGALPEHLVEAELFGYAKGAFTGADATHAGYFERVGRGTLFLDEVGELPLALQPKLLRVLETRSFRPLGSNEVKRFEGRIVAATHRDLNALVRDRQFREDLYFRLAVFVLELPGLDRRVEDIPELLAHFATLHPRQITFSADALVRLQSCEWPGHIRQLRSLVDRLAILSEDTHITAESLNAFLEEAQPVATTSPLTALADALLALEGEDKLATAEQLLVDRAMQLTQGNKTAAARMLGVNRKAVERRMNARDASRFTAQQCLEDATRLIELSSFKEAIPMIRRGLSLATSMPVEQQDRRTTFDLYRQLGVCMRSLDGWLSADALLAYEAAFNVGNGLVDNTELTSLLFGIWTTQLMTMDLGKARGTVQEMLQRAQASGHADMSAEAHVAMANTLFWLGDSAESLACLSRGGLVPVGDQERTGTQGFDLIGLALMFEGLAAFQTGDFARAQTARKRLVKRVQQVREHPFNQAIALQGAAWLACLFEDMAEMTPLATELEAVSRRHGFAFYQGVGQIFCGVSLTMSGRYEEAETAIREGYETHMLRNGGKLFFSFQAWKLGELLLAAGRPAESDKLMSHSLDIALEHQDRAYLGELFDVQGRARMAMGDMDGAEDAMRSALSAAMALGALPARLAASTHLAELMAASGRLSQAREILDKALKPLNKNEPFIGIHRAMALRERLST
ncbi:MAG: sigma 54-interacting transcriptional regulator [Aquabacterium sp.]